MKKRRATPAKISKAWISPSPIGGIAVSALVLALGGLENLEAADHLRERRVLDDVHEQADERRQQTAERQRQDHEPMPAEPAEPERRRRLVLLDRDRLHRTARRLGHLGAPPQDERDRRRRQSGVDVRRRCDPHDRAREAEVDDEDGDEDRQPAEDLDVEAGSATGAAGTGSSAASRRRSRSARCRRPRSPKRGAFPADPRSGCSGQTGSAQSGIESCLSGSASRDSSMRIQRPTATTQARGRRRPAP